MGIDSAKQIFFTNEWARSPSAERAILEGSQRALGRRDADKVLIRCTPERMGANSWHPGGTNRAELLHLTAEFQKRGRVVTVKHINYPEPLEEDDEAEDDEKAEEKEKEKEEERKKAEQNRWTTPNKKRHYHQQQQQQQRGRN